MEPVFSTTTELAEAIAARRVSALEVLDAHLAQIEQHNPALNSVITIDAEKARDRAREADAAMSRRQVWGPLHGVPFTLKDAHATAGMRTTTGFPPLDHVPAEDSTVTARLKAAGGILVGKTNVAPMLADYQSDNPIFGRTNNPWNVERTPGGSSGGAAAAIASGMTPFDIGTDLSGSVRIPAHFCGIYGLKPTENRVSTSGILPGLKGPRTVRIMSCIGPMARSVEDLALLYSIIAGPDGRDTEVQPVPIEPLPHLELKKLRIAFAPNFPGFPIATEIHEAIEHLAKQLEPLCASVEEASLPGLDFNRQGENAGNLLQMITEYEPEQPSTFAQYMEALQKRDEAMIAWEQFFEGCDVLLCPASMTTAFQHCRSGTPVQVDGLEVPYFMVSAHSAIFNYTGHPALVMPYKLDRDGLPLGVQLVGKRWSESRLLAIAKLVTQMAGGFQRPAGY